MDCGRSGCLRLGLIVRVPARICAIWAGASRQGAFGPKGLGTLKNVDKRERRLHPTVAFTPQRICLGAVQAVY